MEQVRSRGITMSGSVADSCRLTAYRPGESLVRTLAPAGGVSTGSPEPLVLPRGHSGTGGRSRSRREAAGVGSMTIVRSSFAAAFLAAVLSAHATPVHSAPLGTLPDTTGLLTSWRL